MKTWQPLFTALQQNKLNQRNSSENLWIKHTFSETILELHCWKSKWIKVICNTIDKLSQNATNSSNIISCIKMDFENLYNFIRRVYVYWKITRHFTPKHTILCKLFSNTFKGENLKYLHLGLIIYLCQTVKYLK